MSCGGEEGGFSRSVYICMRRVALEWKTLSFFCKRRSSYGDICGEERESSALFGDDGHSLNPAKNKPVPKTQRVVMPETFSATIVLTEVGEVCSPSHAVPMFYLSADICTSQAM